MNARQGWCGFGLKQFTLACYFALIALIAVRELWLAPSNHAPLFWTVFKTLPLLLFLPALLRGRPKPWIYASLLALLYVIEGAVAAFGARDAAVLARAEALLATVFFVGASLTARSLVVR